MEEEFQGMGIDEASRLRVVDGISRKRRQMLADLKLDKQGLRDTLRKSSEVCFATPSNGEAPRPAPFACRRWPLKASSPSKERLTGSYGA